MILRMLQLCKLYKGHNQKFVKSKYELLEKYGMSKTLILFHPLAVIKVLKVWISIPKIQNKQRTTKKP